MIEGVATLPTDPGSRLAMCGSKHAYSAYRAWVVAKKMNRNWDNKVKVVPYRCPICNQYHVGGKR